jgi:peptide-methionine (S)-S-oxide reductase
MSLRFVISLSFLVACNATTSSAELKPPPVGVEWSVASFGAGCFWCMETAFEDMDGVHSVVSGYMGGHITDPTYEQVSQGVSGHAEIVHVTFDATKVSYALLLKVFWANVDPFTKDAQFCDQGSQYRSVIFFHTPNQGTQAKQSEVEAIEQLKAKHPTLSIPPFRVEITDAQVFYPAEEYHQDYYDKNPSRYKRYRKGCGRDQRLTQIWGASESGKFIQSKAVQPKKQRSL